MNKEGNMSTSLLRAKRVISPRKGIATFNGKIYYLVDKCVLRNKKTGVRAVNAVCEDAIEISAGFFPMSLLYVEEDWVPGCEAISMEANGEFDYIMQEQLGILTPQCGPGGHQCHSKENIIESDFEREKTTVDKSIYSNERKTIMNDNNEELVELAKDFLALVERAYKINRSKYKSAAKPVEPKRKERPYVNEETECAPRCPKCGREMVKRIAKKGPMAGHPFWACTGYPNCKGTAKCEE